MNKALLSSKKMDWCTPQDFFDKLNDEFHFTLDAAATDKSAKCKNYFTPEDDALSKSWKGNTVFCNPPYGREIKKWVHKAHAESKDPGTVVVMLIPARPDTSYFHDYIFPNGKVRWIRGRLCFETEEGERADPAPFPSCVVVFGSYDT